MLKKILFFAGLIAGFVALYFLVMWISVSSAFRHDSTPNTMKFDKALWQNGTSRERGQMVNSLLDSFEVVGKTKKEIIEIAGKPDYEWTTEDGERIRYPVDEGHAFTYDMIFIFDTTGHVTDILFDD